MFCTQCGKENEEGSLYCCACGARIAESSPSGEGELAGKQAKSEPSSEGGLAATERDPLEQSSSFKASVGASKKKSIRRIPTIVLIALITLLVSSVAFAAYMVYTQVIVPQQQEQARIQAREDAMRSYDSVIQEWKDALAQYETDPEGAASQSGINSFEWVPGTDAGSVKYPHVNGLALSMSGYVLSMSYEPQYGYCYRDLNGDGVDELLVCDSEGMLVSVYALVDGAVQTVMANTDYGVRGFGLSLNTDATLRRGGHSGQMGSLVCLRFNGTAFEEIESVSYEPDVYCGGNTGFTVVSVVDGEQATKHYSIEDVVQDGVTYYGVLVEDFNSRHPLAETPEITLFADGQ